MGGVGGLVGEAGVSDFFFTMTPNLKYFFGGAGVQVGD